MCISNHRSHRMAEASGCPGPSHNLCGNHSWSSSFLWQHLASSWIPKVREHGYRPYTIITEEAYREREKRMLRGQWRMGAGKLLQPFSATGRLHWVSASPNSCALAYPGGRAQWLENTKRSNWVTLGKYLNGNCNWLGGTLAGEVLWV